MKIAPAGRTSGRPMLHDEGLGQLEFLDILQEAIERGSIRAGRHENHVRSRTLPTYRPRRTTDASSGHCTYTRFVIGLTSR